MSRRAGFTLIEAAVTLLLLAVVVVPTVNFWVAASEADASARLRQRALVLAEQVLETHVRAMSFDGVMPRSGADPVSGLGYELTVLEPAPRLKHVTVVVTPPGERQPLVTLSTLASRAP